MRFRRIAILFPGLLAGALQGEAADNLTALLVRPFPARR